MKRVRFIPIFLTIAFSAQNLFAAAECSFQEIKVTVNDDASITVRGLEEAGIKNSKYHCSVYSVSQTWLGAESRAICTDKDHNTVRLWQNEGIGLWGLPAASVALYNEPGTEKIFEAPCSKQ